MTVRIVALTSLKDGQSSALEEYLQIVGPLMLAAGAKIVERYEALEDVVGICTIRYITIVDYPDQLSVDSVFQSPDYLSLRQTKERDFSEYQVCVIAAQA